MRNVSRERDATPPAGAPEHRGPVDAGPPLRYATLLHQDHIGCCLSPGFRGIAATADVPMLVVDAEGFIIFINPRTEALLGYTDSEITGKHITEIVDASASWVATEFSYLADNRLWNGSVLLKHAQGEDLRVSVNAFRSTVSRSVQEYIAFLHRSNEDGPAIRRNPDVQSRFALTVGEVALLELISEGFVEKEIAAILGTSVWSVGRDIQKLLRKLEVSSQTEAGVRALQEGILA